MSATIKQAAGGEWHGYHGRRRVRTFPDRATAIQWVGAQRGMSAAARAASILPPAEAVIVLRTRSAVEAPPQARKGRG